MPMKVLTGAWLAAFLALLGISFNGMSATLGWHLAIKSPIAADATGRSTTAWAPVYFVLWSLAQAVVLVLTFQLLQRYKQRAAWLRLPSFMGMDSKDVATRRLHRGLILFVALAPLYAGGRFLLKTLSADVLCGGARVIRSWHDHFLRTASGKRCWLDSETFGAEYFPPAEAWAFVVTLVLVVAFWAFALRRLAANG